MGHKIDLGLFTIPAASAMEFSRSFDPFAPHLKLTGNSVLPEQTVSGFFVVLLVNSALISRPEYSRLLCGKRMSIDWLRPVLIGQTVRAVAEINDKLHRLRTGAQVQQREANVSISDISDAPAIAISYKIEHLLEIDE